MALQLVGALCVGALGACGGDPAPVEPDAFVDTRTEFEQIQQDIFYRCNQAPCHGNVDPQQMLSLTRDNAYDNLVSVDSIEVPGMARVEPGDPEASYLFIKLGGGNQALLEGVPMPSGDPPLKTEDLAKIEAWISDGAPR